MEFDVGSVTSIGNQVSRKCHTIEEASRRLKMEQQLNIINAWKLEDNEKTGFIEDWYNENQDKWSVNYQHLEAKFTIYTFTDGQDFGVEYVNKESTIRLNDLLNNELIKGIPKP